MCWSRARRVCEAETRPEEQSTEKSTAERRAGTAAQSAETRRKGTKPKNLQFRAMKEKEKTLAGRLPVSAPI